MLFPKVICRIIADYASENKMFSWVTSKNNKWNMIMNRLIFYLDGGFDLHETVELSINPNAISILEKKLNKVDWYKLSENPSAMHLIEKYINKVNKTTLFANPAAVFMLENNLREMNYEMIASNPSMMHIIRDNYTKIISGRYTHALNAVMKNSASIKFLSTQFDLKHLFDTKVILASNPSYPHNLIKFDNDSLAYYLSVNTSAIYIIETHIELFLSKKEYEMIYDYGSDLSTNPSALHIIRDNAALRSDIKILHNPAIFQHNSRHIYRELLNERRNKHFCCIL